MTDMGAGQTLTALHFPPTQFDDEAASYTFTNTTFGVGTTGGTYNDCAVTFIACATGRATCWWRGEIRTTSGTVLLSFQLREGGTIGSGTIVTDASDDRSLIVTASNTWQMGTFFPFSGLTPGSTYNVRLLHRVTAGTGTALRRGVCVAPTP